MKINEAPSLDCHKPFIAISHFWLQHKPDSPERAALLASKRDGTWGRLRVIEDHFSKTDFFVAPISIYRLCIDSMTTLNRIETEGRADAHQNARRSTRRLGR